MPETSFRLSNEFGADEKTHLREQLEAGMRKMALEKLKIELMSGSAQDNKDSKVLSVIELMKGSKDKGHVQTLLGKDKLRKGGRAIADHDQNGFFEHF